MFVESVEPERTTQTFPNCNSACTQKRLVRAIHSAFKAVSRLCDTELSPPHITCLYFALSRTKHPARQGTPPRPRQHDIAKTGKILRTHDAPRQCTSRSFSVPSMASFLLGLRNCQQHTQTDYITLCIAHLAVGAACLPAIQSAPRPCVRVEGATCIDRVDSLINGLAARMPARRIAAPCMVYYWTTTTVCALYIVLSGTLADRYGVLPCMQSPQKQKLVVRTRRTA